MMFCRRLSWLAAIGGLAAVISTPAPVAACASGAEAALAEAEAPGEAESEQDKPAQEPAGEPSDGDTGRKLPFLGEAARSRGYELPLPFGGALVLTRLSGREIEVTDTRIGVEGSPGQSISEFVDLGSTSDVFNANLKFDVWLLPFLNVYTLVGWVYNESDTTARVTVPRPGPIPGNEVFETEIQTELDGFIGGVGVVLAGGFKNYYFVGDASYLQTDLGFDDAFTAIIATLRAGFTGRIGDLPLQMWLGFGNWDTAATASGSATLDDGTGITFEADQKPKTPWMYDIGVNLEFSKTFQLVLDVGHDFEGGWLFVVGPTYRF